MALERKDRIRETTTTTGTGTLDLSGTAPTGFRTFVTAVTSGATVRYLIESADFTEWEVGEGVFTDATPDTLTRVTIYASSNAGSLVNFSAGEKVVHLTLTAADIQDDGWKPASETWTYSSVDDPTGVITVPSDATTKYSVGMRISFVNGGNTIYGIITAVTSTTITFLHEIDPTDSQALYLMANSAITVPRYSSQKIPFGFDTNPSKWTIESTDTTLRSQVNPTVNTWYNLGSFKLDVPIGSFNLVYYSDIQWNGSVNNTFQDSNVTLSTSNSSESDADFSGHITTMQLSDLTTSSSCMITKHKVVNNSSKTSYYLNSRITNNVNGTLYNRNDLSKGIIRAICAYL